MAERVRRCEHIDDSDEVEVANRRDYQEDNTQRTKVHASQSSAARRGKHACLSLQGLRRRYPLARLKTRMH